MTENKISSAFVLKSLLLIAAFVGAVLYLQRPHPSDPYRLGVIVPGEQHFHLKASSPQERQKWLVALGSVKTCLNSASASQLLIEEDDIKRKFCELRLYCDLLVQQVHSIKSAVIESPIPDVQKLDENTSLLGETCDTFIRTIEDCIRLTSPPSPIGYKCTLPEVKFSIGGVPSVDVHGKHLSSRTRLSSETKDFVIKPIAGSSEEESDTKTEKGTKLQRNKHSYENGREEQEKKHELHIPPPSPKPTQSPHSNTFFTSMTISFANIRLNDDGGVPTYEFLESCSSLTKIFDLMGSTAFAPVKMDFNGNIRKLSQSWESDKSRLRTLQIIVMNEMDKGTTQVQNSATDALLWLKRGIDFLRQFLQCFLDGEQDMTECANKAYGKTLKKYHGWVIRGVFSLAAKAAPTREDFVQSLYGAMEDTDPSNSEQDFRVLESEIVAYLAGIERCLKTIDHFYAEYKLDPDDNAS